MDDGLAAARALLPDARLESVERLRGSERSDVQRVLLHQPGSDPETVIVKSFRQAGEGWVREAAALSVLPAGAPAPRLLCAGAEPPVIVLADAGSGPSLADALLADEPATAADALARWAEAVAGLHRSSRELRPAFRQALDARSGELPVAEDPMSAELADVTRAVDDRCASLGVATSAAALDELRHLAHRLDSDGAAAITPADACPDNNVSVGNRVVLLDFEGAEWRHVAWDLAYLRVPWPTCWCSWRLPDDAADAALARYRTAAGPELDVSDADIRAAVLGWAFIGFHMFADRALADDPPLNPDRPTPSRRAMILHRLGLAAANGELAAAADLAARLRAALVQHWGEVELAYAPAFSRRAAR
jgi:hypothetical protein